MIVVNVNPVAFSIGPVSVHGMAFYGVIFAVVIVLLVVGWRLKISILKLLDVGALFAVVVHKS